MSNPFVGTMPPVDDVRDLYGREDVFKKLDEMIGKGKNIVLMGVEGAGKTSVLESYFTSGYCAKMEGRGCRYSPFPH